jgi:hypothetical protein
LKQAVDGYSSGIWAPDELLYAVCCEYTALGNWHADHPPGAGRCRARPAVRHDRTRPPHRMGQHPRAWRWPASCDGGDAGEGSEIVMADDGTASGELREVGAFGPVLAHTRTGGRESLGYVTAGDPDPPATPAQRATDKNTLERGLQHCARNGITSLHNMDGSFYQLALLDELQQEERLLCRAQIPLHLKPEHPLDKIADAEEMHRRYTSDMLWSGRVKMFMDGVHDSRTAFTLRGYPDEPGSTGAPLFSQDAFHRGGDCLRCEAGCRLPCTPSAMQPCAGRWMATRRRAR